MLALNLSHMHHSLRLSLAHAHLLKRAFTRSWVMCGLFCSSQDVHDTVVVSDCSLNKGCLGAYGMAIDVGTLVRLGGIGW